MDGFGRIKKNLFQWVMTHAKGEETLIVAYSGGRDSHVLLHALTQLREIQAFPLRAIHVNHGLQPLSASWPAHCQAICQHYQVPLQTLTLNLQIPSGQSLEAYARKVRYEQWAKKISEKDILLTAHTQSDQAETFLLQLLRGSGIKGLSGIAPLKPFGKGKLARPLLDVDGHEIAKYAEHHGLSWIEDPTNQDLRFRRNTIRKILLPMLKTLNPNIEACIARSAKHCQEAHALLDAYVAKESSLTDNTRTLSINLLQSMPQLKQSYLLRHWLSLHGALLPSLKKCQEILKQMQAEHDAMPCVTWGDWQLRRYQDLIYLSQVKQSPFLKMGKQVLRWDLKHPIQLQDGSIWQVKWVKGKGIQKAKLLTQTLSIAYRQGGERVKRHGQTQSLKKILQTQRIPPWQRYQLPLFYQGDELLAVGTWLLCHEKVITPDEEGWVIELAS